MPNKDQLGFVIEARHCESRRDKKVLHRLLLTRYRARPSIDGSYSFSIPSERLPGVLKYLACSATLQTKVVVVMCDPAGLAGLMELLEAETPETEPALPGAKTTAYY